MTCPQFESLRDDELEALAQKQAEEHLDACSEFQMTWEEAEEAPDLPDPASAPFCGCSTCVVREVLRATMPVMVELGRRVHLAGGGPHRKS